MIRADIEYQAQAFRDLSGRSGITFAEWANSKDFCPQDRRAIRTEVERMGDRSRRPDATIEAIQAIQAGLGYNIPHLTVTGGTTSCL